MSESINFENELIYFNDIDIRDGIIYLYFLINGVEYVDQNENPENKIVLNNIGIKLKPIEKSLLVTNDVSLTLTIRTLNKVQDEFYLKKDYTKRKIEEAPKSFLDRIKMFSGGINDSNNIRKQLSKSTKNKYVHRKIEPEPEPESLLTQKISDNDKNFPNIYSTEIKTKVNNDIENNEKNLEKKNKNKNKKVQFNVGTQENIGNEQQNLENNQNESEGQVKIIPQNIEIEQNNLENNIVENNQNEQQQNYENIQQNVENEQYETNNNENYQQNYENIQQNIENEEKNNNENSQQNYENIQQNIENETSNNNENYQQNNENIQQNYEKQQQNYENYQQNYENYQQNNEDYQQNNENYQQNNENYQQNYENYQQNYENYQNNENYQQNYENYQNNENYQQNNENYQQNYENYQQNYENYQQNVENDQQNYENYQQNNENAKYYIENNIVVNNQNELQNSENNVNDNIENNPQGLENNITENNQNEQYNLHIQKVNENENQNYENMPQNIENEQYYQNQNYDDYVIIEKAPQNLENNIIQSQLPESQNNENELENENKNINQETNIENTYQNNEYNETVAINANQQQNLEKEEQKLSINENNFNIEQKHNSVKNLISSINCKINKNTNRVKKEEYQENKEKKKSKEINIQETFKTQKSQKINDENNLNLEENVEQNIEETNPATLNYRPSKTEIISSKKMKEFLEDLEEPEENEYFLEGTTYDKYLSKLSSIKKKEHETGRESFCEGFFIASFPQKEGQVIENSQSFPSPCGHAECSMLPAMKPEIIARYPLQDTKTLELNNLAATICFPTGIKVCYSEENPSLIDDYVTPITNQKGERYYMTTFHFYHKIMNDVYSKLYEMHPLKHHLMKFGDSYLNMSDEELDENITNKIQESLEKSQELGFRDYVYVPYCICLISKYRYVTEMKKCLQSIFIMIINHLNDKKSDLNNLIMYLIHSVPIPEINTKVKFFVPYYNKGIELSCPKVQDISVMNTKMSALLKYFSIDRIIIIFRLMLFEKKILFIDDDYTRLSLVTDSFISLLYPFQWVHTYIPIMSDQMLKYLETFLPFLNGINTSLMGLVSEVFINNENEDNEEVFLVYISKDKFRLGSTLTTKHKKKYKYLQENVPTLPSAMEKELRNKLKKIKEELDSILKSQKDKKIEKIDLSELDFRIRNVFIDMFVQMFHDYYKYMTFLDDDVVFNKNLFLEKITNNNDKHFYDEFIDTQLFQQFTQNIIKDELNYFTTMATRYEPNKKDTLKRALPTKLNSEKLYIIKPEYLKIGGDSSENIEKMIEEKYNMNEYIKEDGIIDSSYRILSEIDKIKDEYYNNKNCYIYTLPETLVPKENKPTDNTNKESTEYIINKENLIYKALQSLKLKSTKSFQKRGLGMTEKEKDNIKEIIKDFTVKIFKSEEIEEDINLKKDLQNALNNSFGREFFVNILSKNVTNIILLKEKSFQLLGTLIYNSLLFILNIEESNKILEQMVILVRSTKYFGQEIKGNTTTLWDAYKSRIQGYSKVNQANFWNKWYELEIKKETEITNLKKEKTIMELCDIMISLELTKSFVKNVTHGLSEKEFGKESEQYQTAVALITEKIIHAKYISKPMKSK